MKRKFYFFKLISLAAAIALLFSSCNGQVATLETLSKTASLEEVLEERTPVPTAQAGPIEEKLDETIAELGLSESEFLGIDIDDWASLILYLIIIFSVYLISKLITRKGVKKIIHKAPKGLDQSRLEKVFSLFCWLIVIMLASYFSLKLTFLNDNIRTLLLDLCFVIGFIFAYRIVILSIRIGEDWYLQKSVDQDRANELKPVIKLISTILITFAALLLFSIFLSHFGINVSIIAVVLGISSLAISLAAQDAISDIISGFLILADRPFRIGDGIEIQEINTWGDVVEIGLRTTRIRTRDNRMVIIPNSIIGTNQVINYSYPDPSYRIDTQVGIAYGTDIERVRKLIIETVRNLDGVIPDKPVDAFYKEMGDYAMIFQVGWWINTFTDTARVRDKVHTALQKAFDQAGIDCPFPTQSINLQANPETTSIDIESNKVN
jgi:MscS family membrane protein